MNHTEFTVVHQTSDLPISFDAFTGRLELLLGRFDAGMAERVLNEDATAARARIGAMAGEQGLMLFGTQDHGRLFALRGETRKAKRYHVGNPLIAFEMTQHNIRAGLYAPLTLFVHEIGPDTVRVEFDLPSSLFGQFGDPLITKVAVGLDAKLRALIEKAAATQAT